MPASSMSSTTRARTQHRTISLEATVMQRGHFPSNRIKTSIYTYWNFIPKNLFKQFTRFSNLYFVFITALQLIPQVSPTRQPTMLAPLLFIVLVSGIRDFIEDLERHRSDKIQNDAMVATLDLWQVGSDAPGSTIPFRPGRCSELHVGELVRVKRNQEVPADMVILATSDDLGQCYVMTANLDGESSLKPRYVSPELRASAYHQCFNSDGDVIVVPSFNQLRSIVIECEPPNRRIDRFNGSIKIPTGPDVVDLDITNILLKGTQLKDTRWVIGAVIYTGDDTRVRQNSSETAIKRSWIYHFVNKVTLWIVLAQIAILIIAVIIEKVLVNSIATVSNPYIPDDTKYATTMDYIWLFLAYMLLFSNFVPISLQVTIDFTRYFQCMVIQRDQEMWCHPTIPVVENPEKIVQSFQLQTSRAAMKRAVRVQSSELNEELGLIEHIFTDKTGTLTCNRMEFRSCHVDGVTYDVEDLLSTRIAHELEKRSSMSDMSMMKKFMFNLALNNSISPNSAKTLGGPIEYSGPSPDERALVIAAAGVGITLVRRDNSFVTLRVHNDEIKVEILQIFEFTSDRKKSSMVCRFNDGRIVLYSKGADSVILSSLSTSGRNQASRVAIAKEQMKVYCSNGLRVLCIAEREISEDEYTAWNEKYVTLRATQKKSAIERKKAAGGHVLASTLANWEAHDEHELNQVINELERNLLFVGVSGIEDKIQDGAPETLEKFREAGIKVWMLTGDRLDTATNVAYSVRLITSDMKLINMVDTNVFESKTTALRFLEKELECARDMVPVDYHSLQVLEILAKSEKESLGPSVGRSSGGNLMVMSTSRLALLLGDVAVEAVTHFNLQSQFLELCSYCEAVLCARISPKQKELLIEMVRKRYPNKVTLAVGDGANDVPMIQRAHIGVGIAGEEGQQAADSSDYSIPHFLSLQRLVLYHGRGMNRRTACLTLYVFYKNVLLVLPQFVYGSYCLYSGQSTYYDPLLQLFNICFTSLPILYFSIRDQDVSASMCLRFPKLYQDGFHHSFLNSRIFAQWMLESIIASILIVFVPSKLIPLVPWSGQGKDNDLWSLGLAQFFAVLLVVHGRLVLETSMHLGHILVLMILSIVCFWGFVFFMQSSMVFGREFYGILWVGELTQLVITSLFCTITSLALPFSLKAYDVLIAPQPRTICRELDNISIGEESAKVRAAPKLTVT